eukprot:gene7896-1959_t
MAELRQFICVPCAKLMRTDEADEAVKHLATLPHDTSVRVQDTIITQKL